MNKFHCCIITAMLFLSTGVRNGIAAQEVQRIALDDALSLFVRNNLELRIARSDANEAAALARQAGAFPNPTLTGSHEPLSGNERSYSESYLNLGQRLEWPGVRSARRSAAAHLAESAAHRFAADSAQLAFEVKAAYLSAAHASRAAVVLRRVTDVFREGERRAEMRYGEEDISLYEVRRIHVERIRYENLLAEAELDAIATQRELGLLIDPESEQSYAPAEDLPTAAPGSVPEDVRIEAMLNRRAEVRIAEAVVASRQASASLARSQRIPDVVATGGYKRQSDGLRGAYLGLSLSVPLFDRHAGTVDAADAQTDAAANRLALVRKQIENDVRQALDVYRSLLRRIEQRRPAVAGGAGDLLDIAELAYADGEMELIELLDAAEALRDAELADARFQLDLWTAWYDLERALGGALNESEES